MVYINGKRRDNTTILSRKGQLALIYDGWQFDKSNRSWHRCWVTIFQSYSSSILFLVAIKTAVYWPNHSRATSYRYDSFLIKLFSIGISLKYPSSDAKQQSISWNTHRVTLNNNQSINNKNIKIQQIVFYNIVL